MSRARYLFERLKEGGAAEVRRMVDANDYESTVVDFKVQSRDWRSARNSMSRTVTAFANTEGGVLVWGVRRDDKSPAELRPITGLKAFVGELERASAGASAPEIIGIEHESLPDQPGSDTGFALTYVPLSAAAPHRDTEHVHRIRVGDKSELMPPGLFASYFGKRPAPMPALVVSVQGVSVAQRSLSTVELRFYVRNCGEVPLSDIYFSSRLLALFDGVTALWGAGGSKDWAITAQGDREQLRTPFAFSSFTRPEFRVAPSGLGEIGQAFVGFAPEGRAVTAQLEGVLGVVGARSIRWSLDLLPPNCVISNEGNSTASLVNYIEFLKPEHLRGGEFMHHAMKDLAADQGARRPGEG